MRRTAPDQPWRESAGGAERAGAEREAGGRAGWGSVRSRGGASAGRARSSRGPAGLRGRERTGRLRAALRIPRIHRTPASRQSHGYYPYPRLQITKRNPPCVCPLAQLRGCRVGYKDDEDPGEKHGSRGKDGNRYIVNFRGRMDFILGVNTKPSTKVRHDFFFRANGMSHRRSGLFKAPCESIIM